MDLNLIQEFNKHFKIKTALLRNALTKVLSVIERKTSNSIEFPFDLLNSTNTKLEKYSVNHIFIIFETTKAVSIFEII